MSVKKARVYLKNGLWHYSHDGLTCKAPLPIEAWYRWRYLDQVIKETRRNHERVMKFCGRQP